MKAALSIDASKAAALFIDLQEEHRKDSRYLVEGFDAIIANVRRLQQTARAAGIPVLHSAYVVDLSTQPAKPFHPVMPDGSSAFSDVKNPLSAICPEVGPAGDEIVLVKTEASTFAQGDAGMALRARGVEWVFIAGVWTEACIAATVKDAIGLGFRVILVKDACGSGSAAMHQTAILNLANRLYGGAVTDTDGACRMMAGETVKAWMVEGSVPLRFTYENAADLYLDL
ncbi:isochorismatase family protein [Rhodospirillaceae bacterium SYSU D60014]|uniref:isochorismatase family protein n=1 Tax=Virgifigura deserti TaxID=2268457 RepID=UPI000E6630F3